MRQTFGLLLLSLSVASASYAAEKPEFQFRIGSGALHVMDHDQTGLGKVDLLFKPLTRFELIPVVGAWFTGTKDQYYHAGLEKQLNLSDHWALFLGLSAGAYVERDGMDLGHDLEFQSRIGISYALDEDQALDLEFGHLSNARISDLNPGTEFASLSYRHIW